MARYRHIQSGVVVSVSDDTATRLDSRWQSADAEATDEKKPDEQKPRRRRSSRSDSQS